MMARLKQLVAYYGYYHIWIAFINIVSIVALFSIEIKYLIYGLLFYLLVKPLLEIIFHEYISHEMIKPRSKLVDLFILCLYYTTGQTVTGKRSFHVTHHVYYKDPNRDPTQLKIRAAGQIWKYVLGLQRPINQKLLPVKNTLSDTNPWVKMLDSHAMKIAWIYRIGMFLLLPIEWFVALVVYFIWFNTISYNFHDYYFHGGPTAKDRPWYVFLWGNQAWHLRHHKHPDDLYFGPGKWKYLNLCWYWFKIFFMINPDSHRSHTPASTPI